MRCGYYISNGEKKELKIRQIGITVGVFFGYYVSCQKITELTIIEPSEELYCSNNLFTSLIIPDGFKVVYCPYNNISSLIIPKSMEPIRCDLMDGIEEQDRKEMKMKIEQKR